MDKRASEWVLQMSKRVPGGSKASGLVLLFYSIMPSHWQEATTQAYLGSLLWPFREVWKYLDDPESFNRCANRPGGPFLGSERNCGASLQRKRPLWYTAVCVGS